MKTLAEEIAMALPSFVQPYTKGPRAKELAEALGAAEARVRAAMDEIKGKGLATVVRYPGSKARHVVPLDHDFGFQRATVCRWCDLLFERPPKSKRQCCSRSCGIAWSWTRPGVKEKRIDALREERATPEAQARLAAHNARRWSKPEEREKLREQNRREWADPVKRAKRAAGIQAAHGTKEKRRFYSNVRRRQWKEPEFREKTLAGMQERWSKPENKKKWSDGLRERWRDPEQRPKFMAAVKRSGARAAARIREQWADPEQRPALLEKQRERAAKARQTKLAGPISELAQGVLDVFLNSAGALTHGEIKRATGQSANQVGSSLRVLERHGLIRRRECGSGGRSKFVWEIIERSFNASKTGS